MTPGIDSVEKLTFDHGTYIPFVDDDSALMTFQSLSKWWWLSFLP